MAEVTIRTAFKQDIDILVDLLQESTSMENGLQRNPIKQKKGLNMMLENPRGVVLVAEYNGRIVGLSTGQLLVSTAEGGPSLLIEDVIVSEDWRSKGIGKKLVEAVCRWASTFEATRFQLLTDATNSTGIDFYINTGWDTTNLICLSKTVAEV